MHERGIPGDLLVDVEGEIGDVRPERRDLLRRQNAELADLHEAPARLQHTEAPSDRLAGQAVQDDIDTLTAGETHDLVGKVERAGVHDVADTLRAQRLPLAPARRRENLGARGL